MGQPQVEPCWAASSAKKFQNLVTEAATGFVGSGGFKAAAGAAGLGSVTAGGLAAFEATCSERLIG